MEVSGKIHKVFDTQSFGANNTEKREFVVETEGQYPQKIKFELMKDKCSLVDGMNEGDAITVHFNLRGSEWQEKFYVNLQAWKIEKGEKAEKTDSDSVKAAGMTPKAQPEPQGDELPAQDDDLNLPF